MLRLMADAKCEVRVRCEWAFVDGFVVIMKLQPADLHQRLTFTFEGEEALRPILRNVRGRKFETRNVPGGRRVVPSSGEDERGRCSRTRKDSSTSTGNRSKFEGRMRRATRRRRSRS